MDTDNPLFDIAPRCEFVKLNGKDIKVSGLPFRVVVETPELITLLMGGKLDTKQLMERAPDRLAAIIAAGFGLADDKEAIKKASNLELHQQLALLTAIIKATIGGGTGPFVAQLEALMALGESQPQEKTETAKFRIKPAMRNGHQSSNTLSPKADTATTISGA